ncbi:MAG: efflux RND transporter periplasmic adaptor subunit [Deltaproteobacteria bacterium]|jgi:membrane fusion protein (multidrug efflux system)|nr:efflux RND transporter periplasmic adaptor subunit [Deltaproteobacteria bacterium]MDH4007404.1 efflux RND transporter periplasmic adaptor subunit [Desulfuromonadales bacterium]
MNQKITLFGQLSVSLTLSLVVITTLTLTACKKEEVKAPPVPIEVNAIKVEPQTIPVTISFVAQVESSHQVEIVARVNGFLEKILYQEGDVVKQGQTLFLMDQKPFTAQVEAARGTLKNTQAQLWTAQANLNRIQPLTKLDAASKSDLDNAIGSVKSAKAAVHSAQARFDEAELELSYTVIKAPVTGVTGEALVREGTYLTAGPGGHLSYVAQLDPIWVNFSISQNQLDDSRRQQAAGTLIPAPNHEYQVELELSEGDQYPYIGKLSFVDPSFDSDTGTFLARAELPNPEAKLHPGMFVKANLKGATRPNAMVVPQRAVQQTSNGHVVYLVNNQGAAEVRPVVVGDWVEQDWIITKGLNSGDQVITDGFQRLAPGALVKVVDAAPPAKDAQTTEADAPASKK